MPDEAKLAAVREGLPATGAGIYLNTGSTGPIPRETAGAMAEVANWELTTGRAHPAAWDEANLRIDEARGALAAILHADVDAVALTHGATDGMNAALWSIDWSPGDVLVTTGQEFQGVQAAIGNLARRRDVEVRLVDVDVPDSDVLRLFEEAVDGARMVAVSHVTYATGRRLPVAPIARLAHDAGALFALDAAQSVGALPVDVEEFDVDFLALPAQKWLLGPEGMGALYVAPRLAGRVVPTFVGMRSLVDRSAGGGALRDGAGAFEGWNFHGPSVAGVARSCGWLAMYVGLSWIYERGMGLARGAHETLSATPGIEVLTPAAAMGTLVTFRIAGWRADEALDELGRRIFSIARSVSSLDAIRISTAFFNTEAEIGRFCEAVAELARHTPETLPRRPALTILGEG
jgi:L-cysteine/cystine lyase